MKFSKVYATLQNLTYGNINQAELARVLGVSRSNINYKKENDVELSEEEVSKIETYYKITLQNKSDDTIAVPVRGDVEASMGYGVTVYNENQTAVYNMSKQLVQDLGVCPTQIEMIFASGNSMQPTIEGGDSLLVDLSKREVYDGKIYCIRYNGQLYAKRLQRISPTKIKIISDNKDYEPVMVDYEKDQSVELTVIGEIRWAGRVFK